MNKHLFTTSAFCILVGACHNQPLVEEAAVPLGAKCYTITYQPDTMGEGFPGQIALGSGSDSGAAFWIPEARDTHGIWQMFQDAAFWQKTPFDSVMIVFSNGFSGVELRAIAQDSVLVGRAVWMSDVMSTLPPPSAALRGQLVQCAPLLAK